MLNYFPIFRNFAKTEKDMALPEIRITNVDERLHATLINIANNKGISLSALMKHHLDGIIQSYPERLKVKRSKDY